MNTKKVVGYFGISFRSVLYLTKNQESGIDAFWGGYDFFFWDTLTTHLSWISVNVFCKRLQWNMWRRDRPKVKTFSLENVLWRLKMPAVRAPISMPLKIYAVKIHIGITAIQIKFSRISCLPDFQIPFCFTKDTNLCGL